MRVIAVFPFVLVTTFDTLGWKYAFLRDRVAFRTLLAVRIAGEAFNLTMEEVATSVAISIQADKLIFLTEIPGIPVDTSLPVSEDNPIDTELPLDTAKKLLTTLSPPQRPACCRQTRIAQSD